MGEVYRATDARLDRDVAIKVLPAAVAGDPDRLARFEREAKAVAALSHPNILSPTPAPSSAPSAPEQVRGQLVDARSDLFSLGAVIYEMLSGQRAFPGDRAADSRRTSSGPSSTMTAILKEDPAELDGARTSVSPALDRIVRHCLEKNPAERFQSARDVAFALDALSGSASSSDPASAFPTAASTDGRRRGVIIAAAAAAALVIGGMLGYLARGPGTAGASVEDLTYQPVTFDEGFVFAGRFAWDGQTNRVQRGLGRPGPRRVRDERREPRVPTVVSERDRSREGATASAHVRYRALCWLMLPIRAAFFQDGVDRDPLAVAERRHGRLAERRQQCQDLVERRLPCVDH